MAIKRQQQDPLHLAVSELDRVITASLGEKHESRDVLAQIERTICDIEQKSNGKRSSTKNSVKNESDITAPPASSEPVTVTLT